MYNVIYSRVLSYAQEIASLVSEVDPGGKSIAETDPFTVLTLSGGTNPDAVWLDTADKKDGGDALTLARDIIKISPETNIVLLADNGELAYEAFTIHASGYLVKPVTGDRIEEEIKHFRKPVRDNADKEKLLYAQCFGNFEIFLDGKPVRFSRALSKEAMAYLIDRRGAGCTVGEICSVLWEERQADTNLKSQCRVVLASLKKDLKAIGMEDVLVKEWNMWSVDVHKLKCDYYEYLNHSPGSDNDFHGEYMAQYSWAEMTSGTLYKEER